MLFFLKKHHFKIIFIIDCYRPKVREFINEKEKNSESNHRLRLLLRRPCERVLLYSTVFAGNNSSYFSCALYTHTFLFPITIPSHIHHQQCCADLRQFLPISAPLRVTLDALVPLLSEVVAPFKRTARAQSAAFAADKVR